MAEEIEIDINQLKQKLPIVILIIALIALVVGISGIVKIKHCENKGAYLMDDGSCYMPKNEWERKQIEEKGYFEINQGNTIEETWYLLNMNNSR